MIGRDLIEQIRELLRPVATRLVNSMARAVIELVDDGKKLQIVQLQVLEGEIVDDVERFQHYGFKSVPLPGAEAAILCPGGDRAQAVVVADDDRRYRPTGWEGGETGLYTDEGDQVRCRRGRIIVLSTGGTIRLGSSAASARVLTEDDAEAIRAAIATAAGAAVEGDGGAASAAAIASNWPASFGSAKVFADVAPGGGDVVGEGDGEDL